MPLTLARSIPKSCRGKEKIFNTSFVRPYLEEEKEKRNSRAVPHDSLTEQWEITPSS